MTCFPDDMIVEYLLIPGSFTESEFECERMRKKHKKQVTLTRTREVSHS